MKQLLFFDTLITPKILTFCYWLCMLAAIISGCIALFAAGGPSLMTLLGGIGVLVGIRVSFEMIIIMFKMAEYLRRIAENQPKQNGE